MIAVGALGGPLLRVAGKNIDAKVSRDYPAIYRPSPIKIPSPILGMSFTAYWTGQDCLGGSNRAC